MANNPVTTNGTRWYKHRMQGSSPNAYCTVNANDREPKATRRMKTVIRRVYVTLLI